MSYRSAILAAIGDLKDHQTGSSASSIRRRIKEHDNDDNDIEFAAAVAVADDSDDDDNDTMPACSWNETLFQSSLKNLVSKGTIVRVHGSNYKFSDEYLAKRAEALRERAELMEEEERERQRRRRRRLLRVNNANVNAAREEPPKGAYDLPKKKTVHAKVKLTEGTTAGGIITVVNPLDIIGRRGDDDGCDEMETDDDEKNEEGAEVSMDSSYDQHGGSGSSGSGSRSNRRQHPPHLKIIPRMKVGIKSKKMVM